jgi:Tetratricopeptide repeat/TIR domain
MHGAVDGASRVVALFSPAYFEEIRYTTNEWTSALVRNEGGGHRLMPVQIEPCAVPSLLSVDLFDVDESEAARRLLAAGRGPARPEACRAVWYLYSRGDIYPARTLAEHLRHQWYGQLGPDDQHSLQIANALFRILILVGPYGRARQLGEDTLARCRQVLGNDHPDTLRAAHLLASCLHRMGEFELARQLDADTLSRRRRVLGDDHIDVQNSAHNLARNLRELGEVEAARQLSENTLTRALRVFGEDHPRTRKAANNLAIALRLLREATPLQQDHSESAHRESRRP